MRLGITVFMLIFLSACASLDKVPSEAPDSALQNDREQRLSQLEHWRLSARFGASTEEESWSGMIYWEQSEARYDIRFSGPLGQGGMQLSGSDGYSFLRLADGQVYTDDSAETLLESRTGWQLPLKALRYWIQGRPAPDQTRQRLKRDRMGRLARLKQDEWSVEFRSYTAVDGLEMPAKIFLENPHFQVRLVIDNWELNG